MSNARVPANAEAMPVADHKPSPLRRMKALAAAWMEASPEERERAFEAAAPINPMEEFMTTQEPALVGNISERVNTLFKAYVTIEAKQMRLGEQGQDDEADALGSSALKAREAVFSLRDRSGNADLLAARILLDLMLDHWWTPAKGIDWSLEARRDALPLLEILADQTTGVVREQSRAALATIGVQVAEVPAVVHDPMLDAVEAHADALRRCKEASARGDNELADVIHDDELGPASMAVNGPDRDLPAILTVAGAFAAIRHVRDDTDFVDECNCRLLAAALTFLEGVAGP